MSGRDFIEALKAVIAAVPPEQDGLRAALEHLLQSAHFTAPEARWRVRGWQVASAFEEHVAPHLATEGWARRLAFIWTADPKFSESTP